MRAIVARRAPALNGRRATLLDQARDRAAALGRPVPAQDLIRVLIIPLAEELNRGGHYVGFLARLAAERHRAPWVAELDDSSTASFREVSALLAPSAARAQPAPLPASPRPARPAGGRRAGRPG